MPPSHTTFPDGILAQHAHVTRLVGELRRAHADGVAPKTLQDRIDDVLQSVRLHFASEEEQMEVARYPKLEAHHQQHQTFLRRLEVLRAECAGGESELVTMFAESLEHWLTHHERTADEEVLAFLGLSVPKGSLPSAPTGDD
jgi:hemerythrin-like metal-binding protein